MPVDVKATTLVTLAQARLWCHGDAAETSSDALVALCADAASERLERWTSRVFKSRSRTELHVSDGGVGVCYLQRFPIVSVASLTVDDTAIAADRYTVDGARGRLLLPAGSLFSGGSRIAVTYTAGYADADLPSDAIEIALELTKRYFRLKQSGGGVFQQVTVGNSSFIVRDRVPDDLRLAVEQLADKRFG